MARDRKYGNVTISGVGEEEPVFILRAQDALALHAIAFYRELAAQAGCDAAHHAAIDAAASAFANFKGTLKMPDTPAKRRER